VVPVERDHLGVVEQREPDRQRGVEVTPPTLVPDPDLEAERSLAVGPLDVGLHPSVALRTAPLLRETGEMSGPLVERVEHLLAGPPLEPSGWELVVAVGTTAGCTLDREPLVAVGGP
jgi:hypothetical protein